MNDMSGIVCIFASTKVFLRDKPKIIEFIIKPIVLKTVKYVISTF